MGLMHCLVPSSCPSSFEPLHAERFLPNRIKITLVPSSLLGNEPALH